MAVQRIRPGSTAGSSLGEANSTHNNVEKAPCFIFAR